MFAINDRQVGGLVCYFFTELQAWTHVVALNEKYPSKPQRFEVFPLECSENFGDLLAGIALTMPATDQYNAAEDLLKEAVEILGAFGDDFEEKEQTNEQTETGAE